MSLARKQKKIFIPTVIAFILILLISSFTETSGADSDGDGYP
jgi:hypothetical protein